MFNNQKCSKKYKNTLKMLNKFSLNLAGNDLNS